MKLPSIRRLVSLPGSPARYRIEGGDLRGDWANSLRPARVAWCEFTIWGDARAGEPLGSYGGEVWPSAWPALFATPGPRGSALIRLTAAGAEALAAVPS